jgi:DNA-binding NarL/FixJ family response regulator
MSLARLLVLAEERLVGLGLASLLSQRYETHAANSFRRAAALVVDDGIDIALWLGDLLDADAAQQLAALERKHTGLRLCVVARAADADALTEVVEGTTGAVAVLVRSHDLGIAEVVSSLDQVLAGRSAVEPAAMERMTDARRDHADPLACLTRSEEEVLELVACGLRNGEIARRILKSEKAVEKRVSAVFNKLGLDARTTDRLDRRVMAARIFFSCRPHSVMADQHETA